MDNIVLICKALGDDTRVQIVKLLLEGERCACKLLETLNITQSTLSHHMKILSDCSLVSVRKVGKWHHYSLNQETLERLNSFTNELVVSSLES